MNTNTSFWKSRLLLTFTAIISVIGLINDTTSLIQNQQVKDFVATVWPAISFLVVVALIGLCLYLMHQKRHTLQQAELDSSLRNRTWERLLRVIRQSRTIQTAQSVPDEEIQPFLNELMSYLPPQFGRHLKFSVVIPLINGSFKVIASRGMDSTSVARLEHESSWKNHKSFYAALLNDPGKNQYGYYSITDTSYVDTRSSNDARQRPSSSGTHFLAAMRDEEAYAQLPGSLIGILSIGVPKGLKLTTPDLEKLHTRIQPILRAIECLILIRSTQDKPK